MAVGIDSAARRRLAAETLRKHLRALMGEIAGVRRGDEPEAVHRTRVAARRLRNALQLFDDCLPARGRGNWVKRVRRVARALGAARDLDVQSEFLSRVIAELPARRAARLRPGLQHLLDERRARRAALQEDVVCAMDRLEAGGVSEALRGWTTRAVSRARSAPRSTPALRVEALRLLGLRLRQALAYEQFIAAPDNSQPLHAMRIAVKHLRYTLEALAPLFAGGLAERIKLARDAQTQLGGVHDCDVWSAELPAVALAAQQSDQAAGRRRGLLAPGVQYLREMQHQRRATFHAEFVARSRADRAAGAWDEPPASLTAAEPEPESETPRAVPSEPTHGAGDGREVGPASLPAAAGTEARPTDATLPADLAESLRLPDATRAAVLDLARACQYEAPHTHRVTWLALRLFDELSELHVLGAEARGWLARAALLHDIGWVGGGPGHHKRAAQIILDDPHLPWDVRVRRVVGSIARYHRRGGPRPSHAHFVALEPDDQAAVRTLAAVLRIADGLDYRHASAVCDVRATVTPERVTLECLTTEPADVEVARAQRKGDLAQRLWQRELEITWRLRAPSPAEPS